MAYVPPHPRAVGREQLDGARRAPAAVANGTYAEGNPTMTSYPTDLRYTEQHQWVRPRDELVTLGVTQHAADQLGAIGFVELPYPGELFKPGERVGMLSADATSAIKMPFVGQINAVNQALTETPGLINSDPYGEGWLVRIEPADMAEVDALMDAAAYEAFVS
jgi:glycine cleavage system H protein